MNIKKYAERINYPGELKPSLEVLCNLQKAHLLSVPFENLDIHYGNPIELDINKIFKKIILNRRGGFCYELNGLFFELLNSIGFKTKRISAKVFDEGKGYGPEYDHLAVIVTLDDIEYLTDVGFGEFTFGPLQLELGEIQNDERGNFVIDKTDGGYLKVSKVENGKSKPEYIFKNVHRNFTEFKEMCNYHQTNSESHFTKQRMISIPTKEGRITLTDKNLKITVDDSIKETKLKNKDEFAKALLDYFNIVIKQDYLNEKLN